MKDEVAKFIKQAEETVKRKRFIDEVIVVVENSTKKGDVESKVKLISLYAHRDTIRKNLIDLDFRLAGYDQSFLNIRDVREAISDNY